MAPQSTGPARRPGRPCTRRTCSPPPPPPGRPQTGAPAAWRPQAAARLKGPPAPGPAWLAAWAPT
eukprot:6114373-Lingulodinium_polyedra.AAC.1